MFITYLNVFVVGGLICTLGQILINKSKMTTARILVMFLLMGVILEAVGVFKYLVEFGHAGATIPIVGFGSVLAKGAIEGAREGNLIKALTAGFSNASVGFVSVIILGFIASLIFKPKSKP